MRQQWLRGSEHCHDSTCGFRTSLVLGERCPRDATPSSAARLGPAPSYTDTHALSHHCMVTGWSSRHHEKLGVSFTSLKPDPGCGQTLQCQISAPNTSHQIQKCEEERQAQLAVLIATPPWEWPSQMSGAPAALLCPGSQATHRMRMLGTSSPVLAEGWGRELTPSTPPLNRCFQQKVRAVSTRMNEHDWKALEVPGAGALNALCKGTKTTQWLSTYPLGTLTVRPPVGPPGKRLFRPAVCWAVRAG